jgi:hypothetical protein
MIDPNQLLRIRDSILATLSAQQEHRHEYDCNGWIAAERRVMHVAVNEWRVQLGRPPIDIAAIQRVEQWACGHSDYSSKFALYCAELVLDAGPGVP